MSLEILRGPNPDRRRWMGATFGGAAYALACGGAFAAEPIEPPAEAAPVLGTADGGPVTRTSISPYISMQEIYTDNVDLSPEGARSDFITRAAAGLQANLADGRLTGALEAEYAYDWYARNGKFSGGSVSAQGSGDFSLIPKRLWIEADGSISDGYPSTFRAPAIDRAGAAGRTQIGIFRVGPRMKAPVDGFAELEAVVRYERVDYSSQSADSLLRLPPSANIVQALGQLSTGEHSTRYELITTGAFVHDDNGYQAADAVQSLYARVFPKVRLVGRAGYEGILQRGVVDIDAPVLSAGVEFRPNAASRLTFEGGQRYRRAAWSAKADLKVSDRLQLTGQYYETLTPDQVYVANTFEDFVEQIENLPAPVIQQTFVVRENLYNQTSYNKTAELHAVHTARTDQLDFSVRWSDRRFFGVHAEDRWLYSSVEYKRRVRPDLEFGAELEYTRTFQSPIYGASESYGGGGLLLYRLNSSADLQVAYRHTTGIQFTPATAKIAENIFQVAIVKRF